MSGLGPNFIRPYEIDRLLQNSLPVSLTALLRSGSDGPVTTRTSHMHGDHDRRHHKQNVGQL